jgi:signal transduction histidine kinase
LGGGLGVALVKKYVEIHDGDIWLHNEVDLGSIFTSTISVSVQFLEINLIVLFLD